MPFEFLRQLAVKGLIYGLGSSLNGLAGFLLVPFFVRALTAAEYGRFALAEMVLNLFLVLLGMGLNVALLSRYARTPEEDRPALVGSLLSVVVVVGVLSSGLLFCIIAVVKPAVLQELSKELIALVALIAPLETIWLLFATFFRAEGRAWRFIVCSSTQVATALVSTVFLIVWMGYREEGILYGRLVADAVVVLCLLPTLRVYRPRLKWAVAFETIRTGLPLVPAVFAAMGISMAPRYLLAAFGTMSDVGIFAMSTKVASIIGLVFVQPFALTWTAALFRVADRSDARTIYARTLTYYVLIGLVLSSTLGLSARAVMAFIGRQEFPLSPTVIAIMGVAVCASGLMYPLTIGPYLRQRTRDVLPSFVLSLLSLLIVGAAMAHLAGAIGVALAVLAAYFMQAVLLHRASQSLYQIQYEWRRISKIAVANILALLPAIALLVTDFPTTVAMVCFIGMLLVLLMLFRVPSLDEKRVFQATASWCSGPIRRGDAFKSSD